MVAALIPLLAAAIPAATSAYQGWQARTAAQTAAANAPPVPATPPPVILPAAQQPMPAYALTPQGQMVQLPAAQQAALMQLSQQQGFGPLQDHAALVARSQVRHTQAAIDPQLEQIRRQLDHRSLQIRATSEHRAIEARKQWEREVLGRLGAIERATRISHY